MSFLKQVKDYLGRFLLGSAAVPSGLFELQRYFRANGPINFKVEKQEDGTYIAVSTDFRQGSIITQATIFEELDEKIKDAILTTFEVPSSYAKEADIRRQGTGQEYAFA